MTKTSLSYNLWFYNTEEVGQKPSLREQGKGPKYVTKNKTAKKSQSKD